jgi:hypothetical protein
VVVEEGGAVDCGNDVEVSDDDRDGVGAEFAEVVRIEAATGAGVGEVGGGDALVRVEGVKGEDGEESAGGRADDEEFAGLARNGHAEEGEDESEPDHEGGRVPAEFGLAEFGAVKVHAVHGGNHDADDEGDEEKGLDAEGAFGFVSGVPFVGGEEDREDKEGDSDEFEKSTAGVGGKSEAGSVGDEGGAAEKILSLDGHKGGEEGVEEGNGDIDFDGAERSLGGFSGSKFSLGYEDTAQITSCDPCASGDGKKMRGDAEIREVEDEFLEGGIGADEKESEENEEWDSDDYSRRRAAEIGGDGGVPLLGPIDVARDEMNESGCTMANEVDDAFKNLPECGRPKGRALASENEGGGDNDRAKIEGLQSGGIAPRKTDSENGHRREEWDGAKAKAPLAGIIGDEETCEQTENPKGEIDSPLHAAEKGVGEKAHGERDGEDGEGEFGFRFHNSGKLFGGEVVGSVSAGEFTHGLFDGLDDVVGRGSAGGEASGFTIVEPFGAQFASGFDLMDARAEFSAGVGELAGVVAVGSADDDHDIGIFGEIEGRVLPHFGGLANSVDELHFGLRKAGADLGGELADAFNGLRGLGGDTEFFAEAEVANIFFVQDDIEIVEVFGEADDFDMAALADNDGMKSVAGEVADGAVGDVHERTSRFDDIANPRTGARDGRIRSAMGGDDGGRRENFRCVIGESDALGAQRLEDIGIVNELSQYRYRLPFRFRMSQGDGVANAKTHAEMFRADDVHKVLCNTKLNI